MAYDRLMNKIKYRSQCYFICTNRMKTEENVKEIHGFNWYRPICNGNKNTENHDNHWLKLFVLIFVLAANSCTLLFCMLHTPICRLNSQEKISRNTQISQSYGQCV